MTNPVIAPPPVSRPQLASPAFDIQKVDGSWFVVSFWADGSVRHEAEYQNPLLAWKSCRERLAAVGQTAGDPPWFRLSERLDCSEHGWFDPEGGF